MRYVGNAKLQVPNLQEPNKFQFQNSKPRLDFGFWYLFGAWFLEFNKLHPMIDHKTYFIINQFLSAMMKTTQQF